MGCARGAHNGGGIADSGLVTSVSALTNTMVRIVLQRKSECQKSGVLVLWAAMMNQARDGLGK